MCEPNSLATISYSLNDLPTLALVTDSRAPLIDIVLSLIVAMSASEILVLMFFVSDKSGLNFNSGFAASYSL
jgi:hypothetical protein